MFLFHMAEMYDPKKYRDKILDAAVRKVMEPWLFDWARKWGRQKALYDSAYTFSDQIRVEFRKRMGDA